MLKMQFTKYKKALATSRTYPAFTLAEVLITMGIMGIVAAFTTPGLLENNQKQQYLISLKKVYSELNRIVADITQDYGCANDLACTGLFSSPNTSVEPFAEEVTKRMKIVKLCKFSLVDGCLPTLYNTNFDGSATTTPTLDGANGIYKFITADGVAIGIGNFMADCNGVHSSGRTGHMSKTCARIVVDLNGPTKKPNFVGRDIFYFWVTNGKGAMLYPSGGADDRYNNTNYWWNAFTPPVCSNNPSRKIGYYCTGRIIEEGWNMNY